MKTIIHPSADGRFHCVECDFNVTKSNFYRLRKHCLEFHQLVVCKVRQSSNDVVATLNENSKVLWIMRTHSWYNDPDPECISPEFTREQLEAINGLFWNNLGSLNSQINCWDYAFLKMVLSNDLCSVAYIADLDEIKDLTVANLRPKNVTKIFMPSIAEFLTKEEYEGIMTSTQRLSDDGVAIYPNFYCEMLDKGYMNSLMAELELPHIHGEIVYVNGNDENKETIVRDLVRGMGENFIIKGTVSSRSRAIFKYRRGTTLIANSIISYVNNCIFQPASLLKQPFEPLFETLGELRVYLVFGEIKLILNTFPEESNVVQLSQEARNSDLTIVDGKFKFTSKPSPKLKFRTTVRKVYWKLASKHPDWFKDFVRLDLAMHNGALAVNEVAQWIDAGLFLENINHHCFVEDLGKFIYKLINQ